MFRATEIFQNDFLMRKKKIGNYIKSGNPVTDMIGKNNCYTIKVVTQLTEGAFIQLNDQTTKIFKIQDGTFVSGAGHSAPFTVG